MKKGFIPIPIIIILGSTLLAVSAFVASKNLQLPKTNITSNRSVEDFGNLLNKLKKDQVEPSPTPAVSNQPSPTAQPQPKPTPTVSTKTSPKPSPTPTPTPSPFLASVSPSSGKAGDPIVLKGSTFGSAAGLVIFETDTSGGCCGVYADSWSNTEIRAKVISFGAKGQRYIKVQTADGRVSNRLNFEITAGQPIIDSVTPSGIKPYNGAITITGQEFGNSTGYVGFEENAPQTVGSCMIKSWSDTQVVCENISVPSPNHEYLLFIRTADGRESSRKIYYVGQ